MFSKEFEPSIHPFAIEQLDKEKNVKDFVLTYLKEKTIPVSLDVDSGRLTYCEWCGWLGEFQEDFNCPICNKNTYCNSIDYIADTTSPNGVNCFNVFKDVVMDFQFSVLNRNLFFLFLNQDKASTKSHFAYT